MTSILAPGFETLQALLEQYAADDPAYSAQVCVIHAGRTVVDLSIGDDLGPDSLMCVLSGCKGVVGMCMGLLIDDGLLTPDTPVARYWPQFKAEGKADITIRQALSHQAGLPGLAGGCTVEELAAHTPVAERLAAMRPLWQPGTAHGYHGITIGILATELVQRLTGHSFADFYRQRVQQVLDVDFHFGADPGVLARTVDLVPPATPVPPPAPDSLEELMLNGFGDFPALVDVPNHPVIRATGPAAIGGIGNARSLARLYDSCLDDTGRRLVSPATIDMMTQIHTVGSDLVLGVHNRFGLVFQNADTRLDYGSPWSFGHDGAAGAIGFADPTYDIAFGYITSKMPEQGGADPRGIRLAAAARATLRTARRPTT
ncbi:beta-lactamase family protein [Actinomadura graeca]|uniref:Beta-lactamase family protein n=1 Tax=Actinomadura graeca TaxID=2750812 RepID=A0ABX8R0A2_9ACTN|nr:serine hydrolase domain-containing protein [Actinomadura graeca]QXJ23869.1 beta-lactamase family protein [Actinomadura graeca]